MAAARGVRQDVFQAVGDPTRRNLLEALAAADGGMSIAALTQRMPMGRTVVKKHLQLLLVAGLVSPRRVGREMRYTLTPDPLLQLSRWLTVFDRYWTERLDALRQHLDQERPTQD